MTVNDSFFRLPDGTLCAKGSVTADAIEALAEETKAADAQTLTLQIPTAQLPLFEMKGFCTDGVRFTEDGETRFRVHRSFVFDDCSRLTFAKDAEAVLTRTVFRIGEAVAQARLCVTALGFFEPYINGVKLTEDLLIPPKSDYEQRDLSGCCYPIFDKMSHRVYYYEYDALPFLRVGENVFAAHIGNGWYGDAKNPAEGMPQWGDKYLIFRLALTDRAGNRAVLRSAAANTVWRRSHVAGSSLYYGEFHDYRRYLPGWNDVGLDATEWERPRENPLPLTFFMKADFPGDAECGALEPKLLSRCGDRKLYDLGEIASGWPVIVGDADADENTVAVLRYADALEKDGSLNFHHTGGTFRAQRDVYVFSKEFTDRELHPHFLWHAARYIELTGTAAIKRFVKVQSPVRRVSRFRCDNDTLNWFFSAYTKTQEANIHGMVPSDCPHRERLGYTGDGQLTCGAVMSVYDARGMYKKWMRDIRDCQDIFNGHVQHTAPFYGGGGGPGGWGGAAVIVPYRYYQFYDDTDALREAYPSMRAYMDYMAEHCEENLVVREEKDGWCLGDWCPPGGRVLLPEPFVNTYFYIKCADICAETARDRGRRLCTDRRRRARGVQTALLRTEHRVLSRRRSGRGRFRAGARRRRPAYARQSDRKI